MSTFICDTNIWYGIAEGTIDPVALKAAGHRLVATSVNWMELSSKISSRSFDARRRAAQAAIDHADDFLVDTERHLASIWGLKTTQLAVSCREVLKTISAANCADQLSIGVGIEPGLVGRIDTDRATLWRVGAYRDFQAAMVKLLRTYRADYSDRNATGNPVYLSEADAAPMRKELQDPKFLAATVMATRDRIAHIAPIEPRADYDFEAILASLFPYAMLYREYIDGCATRFLPDANDWGDIECFIYSQDGRRVLTAEKRWLSLARTSGVDIADPASAVAGR